MFLSSIKFFNWTLLISSLNILIGCGKVNLSDQEEKIDNYLFAKEIDTIPKQFLFLESQHLSLLRMNHYEEITWSGYDTIYPGFDRQGDYKPLDAFFLNKAKPITINEKIIKHGSSIITLNNEYIHIKLNDGRSGWIYGSSNAFSEKQREYLRSFLKEMIEQDSISIVEDFKTSYYKSEKFISVEGYFKITHFDERYALLQFKPEIIFTNGPISEDLYGYVVDFEEFKISENFLFRYIQDGEMGINFDSGYIFDIRRDPYYFKAIDKYGKIVKLEGVAE